MTTKYNKWTPQIIKNYADSHVEQYGKPNGSLYEKISNFKLDCVGTDADTKLHGQVAYYFSTSNEPKLKIMWEQFKNLEFKLDRKKQSKYLFVNNWCAEILSKGFYEYNRLRFSTRKEHKTKILKASTLAKNLRVTLKKEVGYYDTYPTTNIPNFKELSAYIHPEHWNSFLGSLRVSKVDYTDFDFKKFNNNPFSQLDTFLPDINYILYHLEKYLDGHANNQPVIKQTDSDKALLPFFVRELSKRFRFRCGKPCNSIVANLALFVFDGVSHYSEHDINDVYVKSITRSNSIQNTGNTKTKGFLEDPYLIN